MNTLSIYKRELSSYFSHPIAYAIIIVFVILALGFTLTFGAFMETQSASLQFSFFEFHPWFYMLLAPAVGMRMWADEQRNGTVELLGTFPVSIWSAIFGKYLAGMTVWLVALALTFPIWITTNYLGSPDNGMIFSGYLGSFLLCATFLAITMLVSAFTRDQVVCLIVSVFICVVMVLCSYDRVLLELSNFSPDWVTELVASLGVWDHFRSAANGNIRILDLVWHLSLILMCLLGTSAILSAKRA